MPGSFAALPEIDALRQFDGESLLVSEGEGRENVREALHAGFRAERLQAYADPAVTATPAPTLRWPRPRVCWRWPTRWLP